MCAVNDILYSPSYPIALVLADLQAYKYTQAQALTQSQAQERGHMHMHRHRHRHRHRHGHGHRAPGTGQAQGSRRARVWTGTNTKKGTVTVTVKTQMTEATQLPSQSPSVSHSPLQTQESSTIMSHSLLRLFGVEEKLQPVDCLPVVACLQLLLRQGGTDPMD